MIALLRGILAEATFSNAIIDVGGVGYEVLIPLSTFDKLPLPGNEVRLHVQTQVREDAITLFGFGTIEEKELFKQLINVSGIGGKLGLSVLSGMPVANFCSAVANSDIKALSRIPGIGKRTAERLVVELKDKVTGAGAGSVFQSVAGTGTPELAAATEVALALEQLGFKRDAIDKTLKTLLSELPKAEHTPEILLRQAIIKLNF